MNLGQNDFGDEGAHYVANALQINTVSHIFQFINRISTIIIHCRHSQLLTLVTTTSVLKAPIIWAMHYK